jgi:hypothetical protein
LSDDEDPELEKFANDVIEKEMKRMNGGKDEEELDEEDEDYLD